MRRLDGASAFMVYNEVPSCYQHTLKIAVLNWNNSDEEYSYEELIKFLRQGPEKFPILKWKLARVPLGLNHPVWVQDLEFDISQHVRRVSCPGDKDKKAFCKLVSELYAQPLDLSRPLWQAWIVEDLPKNEVAVITLLHHAYADGAGASTLMQGLLSRDYDQIKVTRSEDLGVNPNKNPGKARLLLSGLLGLPLRFLRYTPPLLKAISKQRQLNKEFIASGKVQPPNPKDAPDSPLNTVHSHGRTFAFGHFDLSDFRTISKHYGATINDLLIAIVSGGLRRFFMDCGYPLEEPLVSSIPINMRTGEQQKEILGNYVDNGYIHVPIHLTDPIDRLNAVKASTNAMKAYRKEVGGSPLVHALELMPPLMISLINRSLKRAKGQLKLFGNLTISNVRGPTKPMYMAGGEVVHWLSIGQIIGGVGVNLTAWSYVDSMSICLMADRKVIQDGPKLIDFLSESFDEYKRLFEAETKKAANYQQEIAGE